MKNFQSNVFATFVGMVLFCIAAGIISLIGILGMAISASSTTEVKDGSVLVLNLDGILEEQASSASPLEMLQGQDGNHLGLAETLSAIQKAKKSDKIKGILIEGGGIDGDLAQLQEMRRALTDFKKSGKWVIAYGEGYSTGCYYVASVADKLYLNPQGTINWQGLGAQLYFVKDMLAKVGIKYYSFKCGKYKSATEMLTEEHMSEPSRQQAERYLGQWWNTITDAVAKSRNISKDSLNAYADRVISLESSKNLVKYKMIDGVLYNDEIQEVIKKKLGLKEDDDIPQATVEDMKGVDTDESGDAIAVYYASGVIVSEVPPQNAMQGMKFIASDEVCKDLADLADDDDVKAVVLRVNSPGGSAYASEQIWHAIENLKKVKPVVVSMSGYAASGGYYISSGANYIYAEPATITGSIGIYGAFPDGTGLAEKLGVKFDEVKTNRNATMMSNYFGLLTTPITPEQSNKIQAYINNGYTLFKSRVAQGRHLSMQAVEERAQGHVFTGEDALKLKLVDALGDTDEAVAKAASLAKLSEYHTVAYPEEKSFIEQLLMDTTNKDKYLNDQLRLTLGQYYVPFMTMRIINGMDHVQALMPFNIIYNK